MLLVSFDGGDGQTSATDESNSAHTLTFNGNAQIDTGVAPPFGTGSLLCDGTGDYVQAADSADWHFGSGDFTVECFARPRISANEDTLISHWQSSSASSSWSIENNAGIDISTRRSFNGTGTFATGTTGDVFTTATWHHVCMERSGDKLRVYVDGVMAGSSTGLGANAYFDAALALTIGGYAGGNGNFDGHIKEVRITKGVARYNSDAGFTAPTEAFPRS